MTDPWIDSLLVSLRFFPPTALLLFLFFFPLSFWKENEKEDRVEETGNWTKHRLKSFPEQVVTGRVRPTQRTTFSKWKVIGLRNSSICLGVIDGERRKGRDRGWMEQESWIEIYSESLPPRRSLLPSKNRNGSKYVTLDSRSSSWPREDRLELHFFFYASSLPSFFPRRMHEYPLCILSWKSSHCGEEYHGKSTFLVLACLVECLVHNAIGANKRILSRNNDFKRYRDGNFNLRCWTLLETFFPTARYTLRHNLLVLDRD